MDEISWNKVALVFSFKSLALSDREFMRGIEIELSEVV